jgi:hypothetical protein
LVLRIDVGCEQHEHGPNQANDVCLGTVLNPTPGDDSELRHPPLNLEEDADDSATYSAPSGAIANDTGAAADGHNADNGVAGGEQDAFSGDFVSTEKIFSFSL